MNSGFNFDKLDTFFLGRELDIKTGSKAPGPLLFKNRNLTTHAAIIGMTGSGKTGLGIGIIEEAAMDGIPVIVIDPKGDMGNLMLAFPGLSPVDFLPWIDEAAASQKGLTPEEFAGRTAETWRKGLEKWWQGPERIASYVSKAERRIFTPGSSAGEPVSMLGSFDPPEPGVLEDANTFNSLINSIVMGLLALVGIKAAPLKSREHLLLSSIFFHFWKRGQGLALESLIGSIINPPFKKLGVLPLETIYPPAQRMELAMGFNTILASPGFSSWLQGEPLDIGRILYAADGRPRISIFSIAHLSEPQRMFFVTILLNRFLNWLRMQQGSSSLRCLLYMDEISGYFPPTAAPPSKRPMLLLLKQARAYGAGIVLSTQNPVDLDYRGLSNIGTWFIGRLQTRQDQDRVLDGLKSASGGDVDVPALRETLSSLPGRTFLLRSVHLDRQLTFRTRWVMSYLRGPLTLNNIKALSAGRKDEPSPKHDGVKPGETASREPFPDSAFSRAGTDRHGGGPPILSGKMRQLFLIPPIPAERFILRPYLGMSASVRFYDSRRGIDEVQEHFDRLSIDEDLGSPDWSLAEPLDVEQRDLSSAAPSRSFFLPLSPSISAARSLGPYLKSWSDFLYHTCRMELYRVKALKLESRPGQSAEDFRGLVAQELRSRKQEELDRLNKRYEKKYRLLEDRLTRARDRLEKERGDVASSGVDTAVSFGVAILGALFGRKTLSAANALRTGRGIRSAGRVLREREDVRRAQEKIQRVQAALDALSQELDSDTDRLSAKYALERYPVESLFIKPRRADIFDLDGFILWEASPDIRI